jgi:hypothetical protein
MSAIAFKMAATALAYAAATTDHTHRVGFVPVAPQEIDCTFNAYKSLSDAVKELDLDGDKETLITIDPWRPHRLPPGVRLEGAPQSSKDAITDQLLNHGSVSIYQGNELMNVYKCMVPNT